MLAILSLNHGQIHVFSIFIDFKSLHFIFSFLLTPFFMLGGHGLSFLGGVYLGLLVYISLSMCASALLFVDSHGSARFNFSVKQL